MSVSAEQAAGHKMRQHFMRNVEGAVCRMTSDDFLSFVDEDKCDSVVYISRHVGKICANGSVVWHFPSLQLGDTRVFFDENELRAFGLAVNWIERWDFWGFLCMGVRVWDSRILDPLKSNRWSRLLVWRRRLRDL